MDASILDLWNGALVTLATVAGPFIAVALAVGLLMSIIQAATQLQESVLSFAPKLIAVGILIALTGHWLLDHLGRYFHSVAEAAVRVGHGGG